MEAVSPIWGTLVTQPPNLSVWKHATLTQFTTPSHAGSPNIPTRKRLAASNPNFSNLKLKQSKSRNGCLSCKKKRIKCDETKPACIQCNQRKTNCEGYKKDLVWRPFGDATRTTQAERQQRPRGADSAGEVSAERVSHSPSLRNLPAPIQNSACRKPSHISSTTGAPTRRSGLDNPSSCLPLGYSRSETLPGYTGPLDCLGFGIPSPPGATDEQVPEHLADTKGSFIYSIDVSPPTPDPMLDINFATTIDSPTSFSLPQCIPVSTTEITRQHDYYQLGSSHGDPSHQSLVSNVPQHAHLERNFPTTAPVDPMILANFPETIRCPLNSVPPLHASSPDMLMLRFHKETAGILSIKNGPSENPWRTLIWPMVTGTDALYHALLAMAALHGSLHEPQLRVVGMAHTTESIRRLMVEMHKLPWEQTLATALALALGETWYHKTSTGMNHLKGARKVVIEALARRQERLRFGLLTLTDARRLKFLANTYVYLYAIACLTTSEDCDDADLDGIVRAVNEPSESGEYEIDPLMGCATTLFPLLGKVASIIRTVRKTPTNSLTVISEANEIKEQLLHWEAPDVYAFEEPEDPSVATQHAMLTAEAYRRAILLHLECAVVELSSTPPQEQAMAILSMLATTPLSSRTMIVQIFPLLIGSCEVTSPEDRQWVTQRWQAMMKRLAIVNVASCWEVVKEVWKRRDRWVETQVHRAVPTAILTTSDCQSLPRMDMQQTQSPRMHRRSLTLDSVPRLGRQHIYLSMLNERTEYTVRGHSHWLSVMSDWGWEVFL